MSVIETDKLVVEMLSVIGYASQTLRLHPDQTAKVEKYLSSERLRLGQVIKDHQEALSVIDRIVVY